ncbi:MAG: carbamoyl-phosphate synthase (glutamine-hydrolyzing) large subunit [Clostridiales Family XIII bacterium]|jgi:carbamoyl-phosphate synthase large subunit|nr:carbamoyl-phosphate synthase (glutamine-hydrolyzing) large subunit [Clostridiales Family XIII bacterium]
MPLRSDLKKVVMIGSGPIVIGQAAEFDYAGTQACRAIREEGIEAILINSNPATIMTDNQVADKVYLEPLTADALESLLERERPEGILAGFGGQTGLNLAMKLDEDGILEKYNVDLLGVNRESIKKAEDREEFRSLMYEIGEPVPASAICNSLAESEAFVEEAGYPVIIRPAYTLGGTGGGFAYNHDDLVDKVESGLEYSPVKQILLEKSVKGWKEIEFEVMRDRKDNCIIICGMENFDPVGVHTGDSIVVAPIQTLRDSEYQMLRDASIKIIRALKIEGGCNVQLALDPETSNYIVIEVNPRVSRSSALASKAAGYPIAKLAAKIALGYSLDELTNYVTQTTSACFEPTLDYCVVKFPKWPFDKFREAKRVLGTQMKATGEVMSISRTFESALLKAITSLEINLNSLSLPSIHEMTDSEVFAKIDEQDDERIFALTEALRRGIATIDTLNERTKIDKWFLGGLQYIIDMEHRLASETITPALLREAEEMGFVDEEICIVGNTTRDVLQDIRVYNDIYPVYKVVDTCGGEFEAKTPYYYSCFDQVDESVRSMNDKVLVVGSGPIRIGQGVEFDYCCVQGVIAIRELGYESIIINNNPETVSTDFDISDKLYFEPLHIDDVMNVIKKERPLGVILQFGGQTSLNLAEKLDARGIRILGTDRKSIDLAEDREKFNQLLKELDIPTPKGYTVTSKKEAFEVIKDLGYPVVVRPSYVIGGRGMQVVYSDDELLKYITEAVSLGTEHPILIDQYIVGKEIEIDAISDGEDILIPGVMEHVEKTGVHSGDSISVYPPHTLSNEVADVLIEYTRRISRALNTVGLVNVQYAYDGKNVFVIEVNPRASRTVPILSKVTGVPMVMLAVKAMLGTKLSESEYGVGLYKKQKYTAVKVPVFSAAKLTDVDVAVGPEMKSTGEVLGVGYTYEEAIYKGFLGSGMIIPTGGGLFVSLKEYEKNPHSVGIIAEYQKIGFKIYSSGGTGTWLTANGVESETISYDEARERIGDDIQILINVPKVVNKMTSKTFKLRRRAIERNLPVLTSMDTAEAFLIAIEKKQAGELPVSRTIAEYLS